MTETYQHMTAYHHRTIIAADIKTHFLETGSGPDLVLLHGGEYGACAEITWRANIETLSKTFHVIAPDLLGWGLTDKLYSFSDPAGLRIKHLQRFLEALGIGKAFFVGNSAGGGLILRASVRRPAPLQIEKMVTICGNASVFKTRLIWKTTRRRWKTCRKLSLSSITILNGRPRKTFANALKARSYRAPGRLYRRRDCEVRFISSARPPTNLLPSFLD